MEDYYDIYSVYSSLKKSAECAFGIDWEILPLNEKMPANFRENVEKMLAAMRRAKRIADLVIANNIVAEKQKELKEAENNLKNLESSDPKNQVSANE